MKTASLLLILCAAGFAQHKPDEIDTHMMAAQRAAGFDYTGTLARLCVAPPITNGIPDRAPGKPPTRESWYTEPGKVFDNLYFVGSKIHSAWALTNNEGIIIIDTLFTYNSEEEIVGGLKKLGLDPSKIKYVIITHAHGDHDGGSKLLQDKFGAHVVMGEPDWLSTEKSVNAYPLGKPKRDIVADDGQKITVGDNTVTIVTTPGHTPGTLSLTFPVKDQGKTLMVVYPGGTAFNFPSTVPNFDIYLRSQAKMAAAAAAAHATVLITNHSEFDNAVTKLKLLQLRKPGEPNVFESSEASVQRYFTVTKECAEAQRLKVMALANPQGVR